MTDQGSESARDDVSQPPESAPEARFVDAAIAARAFEASPPVDYERFRDDLDAAVDHGIDPLPRA